MDAGALDWLRDGDGWVASERVETLLHLVLSYETAWLGLRLLFRLFSHSSESAWGREHAMAQQVNGLPPSPATGVRSLEPI